VTSPADRPRPPWPTPWPEVTRTVERLRDGAGEALGDQLVGLYLHGSLALGDFSPLSSDIDFHAATGGALDGPALERLAAMHAAFKSEGGWPARLEGVYFPVAALRRHDPSAAPAPTVGVDWDLRPGRPGPTWVLDRWVTREHGVVVTGPDPRDLIDPIGPADLRSAVLGSLLGDWASRLDEGADVGWLRPRNYQAFAILTVCRGLHVLERGTVVPKPAAAAWAMERLSPPWPAQVERAMVWRAEERVDDRHLPETLRFIAHAVGLARAAG
jgi:hypothetical protein